MANFRAWTDRSRANLRTDTLDLVQLHCPPTDVITSDEVFDNLDTLVDEGVMAAYGVSVETVDQALAAIARPSVASVQIILNAFRLKPLERVLPAAREAGVGIIARVPLASGLLSGRYSESTTFAADDHRTYNRHGESFDRGETFSGVDYDEGVRAAREFAALAASRDLSPARAALAWVAQLDGVTTVIPGARSPAQAQRERRRRIGPTAGRRSSRRPSPSCTTGACAPRSTTSGEQQGNRPKESLCQNACAARSGVRCARSGPGRRWRPAPVREAVRAPSRRPGGRRHRGGCRPARSTASMAVT